MSEIATVLHCDNSNVTGIVDGARREGPGDAPALPRPTGG